MIFDLDQNKYSFVHWYVVRQFTFRQSSCLHHCILPYIMSYESLRQYFHHLQVLDNLHMPSRYYVWLQKPQHLQFFLLQQQQPEYLHWFKWKLKQFILTKCSSGGRTPTIEFVKSLEISPALAMPQRVAFPSKIFFSLSILI